MKRLLLTAALALLPAMAHADVGVGASLRDRDSAIYVPIESTPELRVEPYFAWSDDDRSGGGTLSVETLTVGIGLFRKLEIRDRTQVYLGGRLGFMQFKAKDSALADQQAEGYALEPTLGIEYRVVDQIAVAFEALLYYRETNNEAGNSEFDSRSTGTANRILLRAYFPP